MPPFSLKKNLRSTFDEALAQLPDALKAEGFGALTEIDVKDTLKKKLGSEFRRYKIVGACHPTLAQEALQVDLQIGVVMPCNVVVYEGDDGRAIAMAVDPVPTNWAASDPRLAAVARSVREKLERILGKLR